MKIDFLDHTLAVNDHLEAYIFHNQGMTIWNPFASWTWIWPRWLQLKSMAWIRNNHFGVQHPSELFFIFLKVSKDQLKIDLRMISQYFNMYFRWINRFHEISHLETCLPKVFLASLATLQTRRFFWVAKRAQRSQRVSMVTANRFGEVRGRGDPGGIPNESVSGRRIPHRNMCSNICRSKMLNISVIFLKTLCK